MKKFFLLGALVLAALTISSPLFAQSGKYDVGKKVEGFSLPDASGKITPVGNWSNAKATVIVFMAVRCPISTAFDARVQKLAASYGARGVRVFGINSDRGESLDEIAEHAREKGFSFPVLKDAGNRVADDFGAQFTPEAFIINSAGTLVYSGQIDDNREEGKVKTRPLANALDAVLTGKPVNESQTRAFGCSIKRAN